MKKKIASTLILILFVAQSRTVAANHIIAVNPDPQASVKAKHFTYDENQFEPILFKNKANICAYMNFQWFSGGVAKQFELSEYFVDPLYDVFVEKINQYFKNSPYVNQVTITDYGKLLKKLEKIHKQPNLENYNFSTKDFPRVESEFVNSQCHIVVFHFLRARSVIQNQVVNRFAIVMQFSNFETNLYHHYMLLDIDTRKKDFSELSSRFLFGQSMLSLFTTKALQERLADIFSGLKPRQIVKKNPRKSLFGKWIAKEENKKKNKTPYDVQITKKKIHIHSKGVNFIESNYKVIANHHDEVLLHSKHDNCYYHFQFITKDKVRVRIYTPDSFFQLQMKRQ